MKERCVHGKPCLYADTDNAYCLMCDSGEYFKPLTNYDRIVSKSIEELAEWIINAVNADIFRVEVLGTHPHGVDDWLDWLKEEVQDG